MTGPLNETTGDDARYLAFMNRFLRGVPPSENEFQEHFDHQNDLPSAAIPIGARAPELQLTDQHGRTRSLENLSGRRGLIIVFVRSTYWCPYCRNQLAELNLRLDETRRAGLEIVAVTSDEAARIREFSEGHRIAYPILTDPDGAVIDAYGVRNAGIPPNDLQGHRPLPHPGSFLISPERVVTAREFTGDIRHRVSVTALVDEFDQTDHENGVPDHAVKVATDELAASVWLSTTEMFGGQEVALTICVRPTPGVHIYGPEIDAPYTGLSVTVDSDDRLLDNYRIIYPDCDPIELAALGETLQVFDGDFTIRGRLRLRWSPPHSPFDELADFVASHAIPPGNYDLRVVLRYQACSESECFIPRSVDIVLPITVAPNAAAGTTVRLGSTEIPPV